MNPNLLKSISDWGSNTVYLVMDHMITNKILVMNTNVRYIMSPFNSHYLEEYAYSMYGSVVQIPIKMHELQAYKYRTNYEEYSSEVPKKIMCAPIEYAYYYMFIAIWLTMSGLPKKNDGTPDGTRTMYFSFLAKRYISIAVEDILHSLSEIWYEDESSAKISLLDEIKNQIFMYLEYDNDYIPF